MLVQGFFLMFIGMGVVFIFLAILVLMVQAIAAVLRRVLPEEVEQPAVVSQASIAVSGEAEIAAVIAAVKVFAKS